MKKIWCGIMIMGMAVTLFGVSAEVQTYMTEGQQYAQSQQFDKAIASFKKCIELDKTYAPPYFNIALMYAWTGDYARAENYVRQFITLRDNEPQAYLLLARVSLELQKDVEVEPALQKALHMASDNPAILYNAGDIWLSMGEIQKAYDVLKKGTTLLTTNEYASDLGKSLWFALLFACREMDRYDEAIKVSQTLLSLALSDQERARVQEYQDDVVFCKKNATQPLFIRAYKVTVGIARGYGDGYRDEIAGQVAMASDNRIGDDKPWMVPPEVLPILMTNMTVVRVEQASKSAMYNQLVALFQTMVGSRTIVVEVKDPRGEKGYLLFEPIGKRVLLKAVYLPGGTMFRL